MPLEGNAADPMYPKMERGVPSMMERGVPSMADRALRIVEGEEPL